MQEKISQQTIDQVKQYSGIVEFIQQYVKLTKRGQNFVGLCPFHSERTPSFTVSPQKKIFHCFGCHESGDLISFAEKIDSLTFYESIEVIAQFAGIPVLKQAQSLQSIRQNKELESILSLLKQAASFFIENLSEMNLVKDYIKSRNLNQDSIDTFKLGFCSDSNELISFLKSKSFSIELMTKAGLMYQTNNQLICRFYKRLIFPITDHQGRIVGFGGRVLDPNSNMAKYVNSDESYLFNKRKLLFGLSFAKSSIKENGFVILVEGYIDVITMYQHGIKNVVACMGTSLTSGQVQLLKRFTDSVVLMFDNDSAGVNAMNKSLDILLEESVNVSVVSLISYDPADFINHNGKDAFIEKLNTRVTAFDFFYNDLKINYDLSKIEDVSKVISLLVPKLSLMKDEIVRNHYISIICTDMKIKEEVLVAKINHFLYNGVNYPKFKFAEIKKSNTKLQKAEEIILAIISGNLDLRKIIRGDYLDYFTNSDNNTLITTICDSEYIDSELFDIIPADFKQLFSKLVLNNSYSIEKNNEANMFNECLLVLKKHRYDSEVLELKNQILESEKLGNEDELLVLLKKLDQIKKGGINGY